MIQRGLASLVVLIASIASFASARGAADTAPPVVSITFPRAGDTLTDTTLVTATASDDTGVVGVQFLLDGQPWGREVTAPPYQLSWTIASSAQNGLHELSAVARDAAGNRTTAASVEIDVQGTNASHDGPRFKPKPLPSLPGRLGITLVDWYSLGLSMVPATDPTPTKLWYIPFNRDQSLRHDRVWYRAHHPQWVMYKCDRTRPATLFGNPIVMFDITNPEVRDYQLNVWVRVGMKQGVAGIFFDNVTLIDTDVGMCGHYGKDRTWVPQYSGRQDPAWPADIDAWLAWIRERIHAIGGLVVANVGYVDGSNPQAKPLKDWYDRIASRLDALVAEGGEFVTECKPRALPGWRSRFDTYRRLVQSGRGLMIQENACDNLSDMTAELRSWMFANYLLLRSDKTYISIVPRRGPGYWDGAEYYLPIGAPAGDPVEHEHEGLWTRPYQHGLVAVNPDGEAAKPLHLGSTAYVDIKGAVVSGGQLVAGGQLFNGRVLSGTVSLPPASGLVLLRRGIETLTASVSAGRAPLAVTFTGYLVNGTPACAGTDWYSMVFGDGTSDFVTVPAGTCGPHRYQVAHTYARPGAYDVVLSRPSRAIPARTASIPLGHAPITVTGTAP